MAAVNITITGMLYDKINRTSQNVALIGEAFLTDFSVGGGPIIPPGKPIDPGARPEHPIFYPPGTEPHPEHPIVIPEPPTEPPTGQPDDDGFLKPPPPGGGWAYHEDYGWMYAPGSGQAGPKKP